MLLSLFNDWQVLVFQKHSLRLINPRLPPNYFFPLEFHQRKNPDFFKWTDLFFSLLYFGMVTQILVF